MKNVWIVRCCRRSRCCGCAVDNREYATGWRTEKSPSCSWQASRPSLEFTQSPTEGIPWPFAGVYRWGRGTEQSLSSGAEVKKEWSFTYITPLPRCGFILWTGTALCYWRVVKSSLACLIHLVSAWVTEAVRYKTNRDVCGCNPVCAASIKMLKSARNAGFMILLTNSIFKQIFYVVAEISAERSDVRGS
jgi:hypothetical protein